MKKRIQGWERGRPGCGSGRLAPNASVIVRLTAKDTPLNANDEGVVGCARGGRAPNLFAALTKIERP